MPKKLIELFDVTYGNKLDFNKMKIASKISDAINFVGRSSENHGVVARVAPIDGIMPFEAGLITVALGGTKLLASFVQMYPFYTAQNVAVLKPLQEMSFAEKLFVCLAIRHNRFRYSAFGREANRTLRSLLIPEPAEFPEWVKHEKTVSVTGLDTSASPAPSPQIQSQDWQWFAYDNLFSIDRGRGPRKKDLDGTGSVPFITAIDSNNGLSGFTNMEPRHPGNTISVNRNGNGVAEAYYQPTPFCSTEDVHIFTPKFTMNTYIALFLVTLIRREKYRFSYGRKWGIERMKSSKIKLPVTSDGNPDWNYMEHYIKTLPFSASV